MVTFEEFPSMSDCSELQLFHEIWFEWRVSMFQKEGILCDPMDYSLPGSSAHGIFPARILEWIAISSSRGSSWPRGWIRISCLGRWILYHWAIGAQCISSQKRWGTVCALWLRSQGNVTVHCKKSLTKQQWQWCPSMQMKESRKAGQWCTLDTVSLHE